jgi:glycosyltransferase involved in cell wall biosynthesis
MRRCPTLNEIPPPPPGRTGWPWTAEGAQLPEKMPDGNPWPRISIVTPSYNQADFLEATIRSILLQGYPNLEYIINDGGSTDGSIEIIRKYEPWLTHWESGPDGGQYAAVQKGFTRSSGEIMAWLNSDDLYYPWALRVTAEIFTHLPTVRWLSSKMLCTMNSQTGLCAWGYIQGYSKRSFFLQDLRKRIVVIQQESTFWKRELWEQAGARLEGNLHYAGDFELWTRFWQYENLTTTTTPLGIFRIHGHQKTSNLGAYYDDARVVLKRFRRPLSIPPLLLFPVLFILRLINPTKNWLGIRTHSVDLNSLANQWIVGYSYREGLKLI